MGQGVTAERSEAQGDLQLSIKSETPFRSSNSDPRSLSSFAELSMIRSPGLFLLPALLAASTIACGPDYPTDLSQPTSAAVKPDKPGGGGGGASGVVGQLLGTTGGSRARRQCHLRRGPGRGRRNRLEHEWPGHSTVGEWLGHLLPARPRHQRRFRDRGRDGRRARRLAAGRRRRVGDRSDPSLPLPAPGPA